MFQYRIAYGCWLNDSRTKPIPDEDWPSVRIDGDTLESLDETMAFLKGAGYNCFDVFGLITNHSWEDDIASTVGEERRRQVKQAIDIVHRHGLKLIYGLGVYSWGFDGIIARDERVRGTSAQAMCASSDEADAIMRRVIDFVGDNFDIDGFHLEAADQGRCECARCQRFESDIDYYNSVNARVARYIRSRWPEKLLLVNTSGYLAWGDVFTGEQLEKIRELAREIDIFIDVGSHGLFVDPRDRAALLKDFPASFGTANGFWVYPPQRWDRLRFLIPHHGENHRTLKSVYEDGGRSCELYLSPLVNPGAEIAVLCNGLFLQTRSTSGKPPPRDRHALRPATDCGERTPRSRRRGELFFDARTRARPGASRNSRRRRAHLHLVEGSIRSARPGELFLEPLFGVGPGFPCYLTVYFDAEGRRKYREGMRELLNLVREAIAEQPSERLGRIERCIEGALADIDLADAALSG